MSRKPNRHWTAEKVDEVFDLLKDKIGRTPRSAEFMKMYPGAFALTACGRYLSYVKSWNDYLRHRGLEVNHDVKKWFPKSIDEAFDTMKRELGRNPGTAELVERYGGILDAIRGGKYSPNVKSWNDYLICRGLDTSRISWNSKTVDKVFDEIKRELGRTPSAITFRKKSRGALDFIVKGRYANNVKSWNDYLRHRGLFESGWTPENIDKAFDELKDRLGKNPNYDEFKSKNSGAICAIVEGRYNKEVKNWGEYLEFRGLSVYGWTSEKVDEAFDEMREELGEHLASTQFRNRYAGALSFITRGRYHHSITKWSQYVAYRMHTERIDGREQVESLLEGYLDE